MTEDNIDITTIVTEEDSAVERVHHVEEKHSPEDIILYTAENKAEDTLLTIRNIAVCVSFCMFITIRLPIGLADRFCEIIRIAAYFIGGGAYLCEIFILTDFLKRKHNPREMLLPYAFGVMYVLLGLSYIFL